MPSTFTWLDYSEHERRKMLDVIELFGERTTRDELGLGGVRDAFADQLFPGTSTIQTRARYFLLIPWIYLGLEAKRVPSENVRGRGRVAETEVMRAIALSDDSNGLIGRQKEENVQRLPSSIYWNGLGIWGIRKFHGSQDAYHRSLNLFYVRRKSRGHRAREFDGEAADEPDLHNWDASLPTPPEGFPKGVSFRIRRSDAEYLRERLLTNCSSSLMAHLVRDRVPVDGLEFAWYLADLPDQHHAIVNHGRNFSEIMHGAQLLYNLLLAEKRESSDLEDGYRERFGEWAQSIGNRLEVFRLWNLTDFWRTVYRGNPRVSSRARGFVDRWIALVLAAPDVSGIADDAAARTLVAHREVQLKGALARVRGGRPLEMWGGESGADQLDLRWRAAKRLVADILAGLEADDDA